MQYASSSFRYIQPPSLDGNQFTLQVKQSSFHASCVETSLTVALNTMPYISLSPVRLSNFEDQLWSPLPRKQYTV